MGISIFGCGGMGREAALIAEELGIPTVFVSDDPADRGNGAMALEEAPQTWPILVAIGDPRVRRDLVRRCEAAGRAFASLTSPTARVRRPELVGEGAMWCDFSLFTGASRIGRHFQCNGYSGVGHDCVVGDFVTLGPRVSVCGHTVIGDGVFIGNGALLGNGTPDKPLVIGAGAVVGMGAVVTRDVEPGTVVWGSPAQVVRAAR